MRFHLKFARYLVASFAVFSMSTLQAGSYDDFFRAVSRDDVAEVSGLLARGFDPNSPDENGQPALTRALRDHADKVAAVLLQQRALKVDAANNAGETPLMIAALQGDKDWCERLLQRGSRVDRSGWSPLHYAASGPDPATVELLLKHGAGIDARSPNGTTPLMMAARYGSSAAAELLLARGADPRLRNDLGLAATDFARMAEREALAERLAAASR